MRDECLICKAPLEYLTEDLLMECAVCHREETSKTRCVNGHYVCSECHTAGIDAILSLCLSRTDRDPIAILEAMMAMEFCHMHGPEHHTMVGAALLTACKNAGGAIDLPKALLEMFRRGKAGPGGVCGFWGACGAGISTGMYVSILTGSTPLSEGSWGDSNRMTSQALNQISRHGGPRCCKRNSYLAVLEAAAFTKERFGIELEPGTPVCSRSHLNHQCRKSACPFHPELPSSAGGR